MPSITPCLWFDNQAEEAANFYISVFGSGQILGIERYVEGSPFRNACGIGDDRQLRARRSAIHRIERRTDVHVLGSSVFRDSVRRSG